MYFPNAAHIGARFSFLPAILKSSTYTDKNNFFSRCTNRHSHPLIFSNPHLIISLVQNLSQMRPARGWPYKLSRNGQTGSSIVSWKCVLNCAVKTSHFSLAQSSQTELLCTQELTFRKFACAVKVSHFVSHFGCQFACKFPRFLFSILGTLHFHFFSILGTFRF